MKKKCTIILIITIYLLPTMLISADEYSNAMNGVNAIKQGNSLYERGCNYYDSRARWDFPGTNKPNEWNKYIREINQKLKSLDKGKKYFYDAREKYNYASQVFGSLTILKSSRNIRVYQNNLNLARRNSNNCAKLINKTDSVKSKLKNSRSDDRDYIAKSKEKDDPVALKKKIFHSTNYNGNLYKYNKTVTIKNDKSFEIKAVVYMWAGVSGNLYPMTT